MSAGTIELGIRQRRQQPPIMDRQPLDAKGLLQAHVEPPAECIQREGNEAFEIEALAAAGPREVSLVISDLHCISFSAYRPWQSARQSCSRSRAMRSANAGAVEITYVLSGLLHRLGERTGFHRRRAGCAQFGQHVAGQTVRREQSRSACQKPVFNPSSLVEGTSGRLAKRSPAKTASGRIFLPITAASPDMRISM